MWQTPLWWRLVSTHGYLLSSHWLIYTVYVYIEHNDTCQTSSKAIHYVYILVETASITHTEEILEGWGLSDFDCLHVVYVTIFMSFYWQIRRKEVNTVYQFIFRVFKNLWNLTFLFVTVFFCDFEKFLIANNTGYNFC